MRFQAMTLLQPYATAILPVLPADLVGPKGTENRPQVMIRVPPEGLWMALHAGKDWYGDRLTDEERGPWLGRLRALWPDMPPREDMPRKAILGLMHFSFVERYPTEGQPLNARHRRLLADPWAFGPVCYSVDRALRLPDPIPCRGMQGCWPVPDEHVPALVALLKGAS